MRNIALGAAVFGLLIAGLAGTARAVEADEVLVAKCSECHATQGSAALTRIDQQRKTPEGWVMTLFRMDVVHGVKLTDAERRALVKHLSDKQGLAPSETAGYRYILERTPNVVEEPADAEIAGMCARCHSDARSALQRRTEEEWRLLVHQHLGQWPTTEFQSGGRDREWFKLALGLAPTLAKAYPLKTKAWSDWQKAKKPDLAGSWRLAGRVPNRGLVAGVMQVDRTGPDRYAVETTIDYENGEREIGTGSAIVYTGFEWRARINVGGISISQVLAASVDGKSLAGRMFRTQADEIGAAITARRQDGGAVVMAVTPDHLKTGVNAHVTIIGTGLTGKVSLGDGVEVGRVVARDAGTVVVSARAAFTVPDGPRRVQVGTAAADGLLTVYGKVDTVRVEPGYAIARVGGGSTPRVQAAFEAVSYTNGADGKPGTDDDLRIGAMPAVWTVAPFDDVAKALDDVKFAGMMDAETGVFTPAVAGPNEARPFSTNNAGNLKVTATVSDGGRAVSGDGQLVVTVQRWNDPPIR